MTSQPIGTIGQALSAARREPFGESWRLETELLLLEVLSCSRETLLTWPERALSEDARERFEALVDRRRSGEPIAYILGRRQFWDFELVVSPAVLIPRPETELLVELSLAIAAQRSGPQSLVDLGTGSGAIAIALARADSRYRVTGVELSSAALAIARGNGARLAGSNLTFTEGSWLDDAVCAGLVGQGSASVDILVSNPPYIAPDDEHLLVGDLVHEPRLALSCAEQGLESMRSIATDSRKVLKIGGWLLFEHGYDQRDAVAELLRETGYREVECLQDIAGQDRVTRGVLSA